MTENPIVGFQVDPSEIRYIGQDLQRPECILAEPDGTLWAADARGGVVRFAKGSTAMEGLSGRGYAIFSTEAGSNGGRR